MFSIVPRYQNTAEYRGIISYLSFSIWGVIGVVVLHGYPLVGSIS
jgi:hypothetical protein